MSGGDTIKLAALIVVGLIALSVYLVGEIQSERQSAPFSARFHCSIDLDLADNPEAFLSAEEIERKNALGPDADWSTVICDERFERGELEVRPGRTETRVRKFLRPFLEIGLFITVITVCAVVGRLVGFLGGLVIILGVTFGGFANWLTFLEAYHLSLWGAFGFAVLVGIARIVGENVNG